MHHMINQRKYFWFWNNELVCSTYSLDFYQLTKKKKIDEGSNYSKIDYL